MFVINIDFTNLKFNNLLYGIEKLLYYTFICQETNVTKRIVLQEANGVQTPIAW